MQLLSIEPIAQNVKVLFKKTCFRTISVLCKLIDSLGLFSCARSLHEI